MLYLPFRNSKMANRNLCIDAQNPEVLNCLLALPLSSVGIGWGRRKDGHHAESPWGWLPLKLHRKYEEGRERRDIYKG